MEKVARVLARRIFFLHDEVCEGSSLISAIFLEIRKHHLVLIMKAKTTFSSPPYDLIMDFLLPL